MLARLRTAAVVVAAMIAPSNAAEPVQLCAAGSLRFALTDIAAAFESAPASRCRRCSGHRGR
jgi:ABC-type molybdate transport system substrate-binding protein